MSRSRDQIFTEKGTFSSEVLAKEMTRGALEAYKLDLKAASHQKSSSKRSHIPDYPWNGYYLNSLAPETLNLSFARYRIHCPTFTSLPRLRYLFFVYYVRLGRQECYQYAIL